MPTPLFVCHANCARSVLACYLYRQRFEDAPALSAGMACGPGINNRAAAMLRHWGIDPSGHTPRQIDRALCEQADGIFLMAPTYLCRLLREYGGDLAGKTYLFADPFTRPRGFDRGEYRVRDPSFDRQSAAELAREFDWMRERVAQIHQALLGQGGTLVPAADYLELIAKLDPNAH